MAQENEYISSAAETMFESSQDESIRIFMEGVEEANRIRRGQELRIERAEATIARKEAIIAEMDGVIAKMDDVIAEKDGVIAMKDAAIVEKDDVIAMKDAEIARLKALLENK